MDGASVINSFTPVVNSLDRLASVLPNAETPRATTDQIADVLDARDTKHSIRSDRQKPMWKRVLQHAATGAGVGGGMLGLKGGTILGHLTGEPLRYALAGAGLGTAIGAGTGVATELFDRASERRRNVLADETLKNAHPGILKRLKDPDVQAPARAYASSRNAPMQGAELGATLGSIAGGAIGAYTGGPGADHWSRAAVGGLLGMSGLGAAGLLAGALWKRHQRQKLVETISKRASVWLNDNDLKIKIPTGGRPFTSSNRRLMEGQAGIPESYSSGTRVYQQELPVDGGGRPATYSAGNRMKLADVMAQFRATGALASTKVAAVAPSVEHSAPEIAPPVPVPAAPVVPPITATYNQHVMHPKPENRLWNTVTGHDAGQPGSQPANWSDRLALENRVPVKYDAEPDWSSGDRSRFTPPTSLFGSGTVHLEPTSIGSPRQVLLHEATHAFDPKGSEWFSGIKDLFTPKGQEFEHEVPAMVTQNAEVMRQGVPAADLDPKGQGSWVEDHIKRFGPQLTGQGTDIDEVKRWVENLRGNTPLGRTYKAWLQKNGEENKGPKLRSRSEVCVYSKKGILGIKKDGYLLMPGGGIDDGETPEFGAYRETIEEADRKLLHLEQVGTSECLWPDDVKLVKGFDGSKTYHFIALDGGRLGTEHEDNEKFKFIAFSDALSFLDDCMKREDQESAKDQNEGRRLSIEKAWDKVKAGDLTATKLAELELNVPQQKTNYTCGPCCITGILDHLELPIPDDLDEKLETSEEHGTKPEKMVQVLKDAGCDVEVVENCSDDSLKASLGALKPVLMLIKAVGFNNEPTEDHYVVAIKLEGDHLIVADPTTGEHEMIPMEEAPSEGGLNWLSDDVAKTTRWAASIGPAYNVEKTADALNLIDRPEHVVFNPQGQILVAADKNKRYRFPTVGSGSPAPYEPAIRLLPPEGIPDVGAHGYNVRLHSGEATGAEALDDGTWQDPTAVLRGLYGSMGLAANRPYRDLDRARARVILKSMKKRQPVVVQP